MSLTLVSYLVYDNSNGDNDFPPDNFDFFSDKCVFTKTFIQLQILWYVNELIDKNGSFVNCMEEKPTIEKLINTGMYVVSKDVYNYLPNMKKFHMTHVVEKALEMNQKVAVFEIDENDFMDMGVMDELKNMNEKVN